jgi:hypothetical protein
MKYKYTWVRGGGVTPPPIARPDRLVLDVPLFGQSGAAAAPAPPLPAPGGAGGSPAQDAEETRSVRSWQGSTTADELHAQVDAIQIDEFSSLAAQRLCGEVRLEQFRTSQNGAVLNGSEWSKLPRFALGPTASQRRRPAAELGLHATAVAAPPRGHAAHPAAAAASAAGSGRPPKVSPLPFFAEPRRPCAVLKTRQAHLFGARKGAAAAEEQARGGPSVAVSLPPLV